MVVQILHIHQKQQENQNQLENIQQQNIETPINNENTKEVKMESSTNSIEQTPTNNLNETTVNLGKLSEQTPTKVYEEEADDKFFDDFFSDE